MQDSNFNTTRKRKNSKGKTNSIQSDENNFLAQPKVKNDINVLVSPKSVGEIASKFEK